MKTISANLNIMIKASDKASKILIRDFGEIEKLQVSKKGPKDFVTNSDLKTEKIIIEELKKARPHYSILSEESGYSENKDLKNTWIIDPIDGTTNFLHGVPHFAISIALKTNNEIVSGLIYDPIKDEIFFAEKDKNEPDIALRKSGCAALDMAYIASGRYDGYFQNGLNLWDIAAGIILIKEAGGIINDINLNKSENIKVIASNSNINTKFKEKLVNF